MGTRDGDIRQWVEVLNACHPWYIVGPREYEVSIVIEETVFSMAQKADDLEDKFGCYNISSVTNQTP